MADPKPKSTTFETTVTASGNNTGMVVPDEAIDQLAAGKRPSVVVNVNGYEYRNTVAVMSGKYMIGISAAIRKATGLKGGDPIRVTLTVADTPREVDVPADFAAALAADEFAESLLREALQQLAAVSHRQCERCQERRDPSATHRESRLPVSRRQAAVNGRTALPCRMT
jgi:hypothetical protein